MAQEGLRSVAKKRMLEERGALSQEEGDFVKSSVLTKTSCGLGPMCSVDHDSCREGHSGDPSVRQHPLAAHSTWRSP